jgi:hypothetical protein
VTKKPRPIYDAHLERIIAWTAAAFAALALAGLLFEPALRLLWIVVLIFSCGAVGRIAGEHIRLRQEPRSGQRAVDGD